MNVLALADPAIETLPVRCYQYRHIVTFEETNLVGNVYYTNYVRWQGACREMFLIEHAPSILADLATQQLLLHTSALSCEFLSDQGLAAGDRVLIEMRLEQLRGGRMSLHFDYYREVSGSDPEKVATGSQTLCSKHRSAGGRVVGCPLPVPLLRALVAFAPDSETHARIEEAIEFQR